MEDIFFKITEDDIREYLKIHKNDGNIKHREAMFVKYMKENGIVTEEVLEILMNKYNNTTVPNRDWGLYSCEHNSFRKLPNFSSSYEKTQKLDISGICHILVPALRLYQEELIYKMNREFIAIKGSNIRYLASALNIKQTSDIQNYLSDAIDNYKIVGGVKKISELHHDSGFLVKVLMDIEDCKNELNEYESIYGLDNVKELETEIQKRLIY